MNECKRHLLGEEAYYTVERPGAHGEKENIRPIRKVRKWCIDFIKLEGPNTAVVGCDFGGETKRRNRNENRMISKHARGHTGTPVRGKRILMSAIPGMPSSHL